MSFNELELKRIDRTVGELCRRSNRPEYPDQLRFECEIGGGTVSIWEVRPPWDGVGEWTRMGSPASASSAHEARGSCTGCAEISSGTATIAPSRLPISRHS
jgi:hypothetical protein